MSARVVRGINPVSFGTLPSCYRSFAKRSPLSEDQVRAALGAIFFALSVLYVAKTISAAVREAK